MDVIKMKWQIVLFFVAISTIAGAQTPHQGREHLLMDAGWRFAFGHPYNTKKDFNNGTGSFSYMAKAGYGDGAAATDFDDRAWRSVNLPHDWAVEQPFSPIASYSHGFKAIGRNFPDASVGWYRKTFSISTADIGRRIHIAFDGVFRNSIVWVNGHYLGTEASGYSGFEYDITDYLNYGGENLVAVRADATMEEGWFYEGAGIYRHVWLNKTDEVHIPANGIFVASVVKDNSADITATTTIVNEGKTSKFVYIIQTIVNADGKIMATDSANKIIIPPLETKQISNTLTVQNPKLWNIETPYLHQMITTIKEGDKILDAFKTTFGIRSIRFDANEGFFLNGKHVKIKGTNNHQDHAGVGVAMPDALQNYRVAALKSIGCNSYRCAHNPPTPELLEVCDRLGMMVIVENRLMGITQYHLDELKSMILRDRNHPCVISWSIGNEEWQIENNEVGARIASTMQAYVKKMDSTRPATAAFSGGMGSNGITTVMDLLGINYIVNKSTDKQHALFPKQAIWGTEEGSTVATRGIYVTDNAKHYRAAYDMPQNENSFSIEQGWKHYAERPYLAGMFIWTGFDYRGEPTPFGWPSNTSLFGMLDNCGFPKDDAYYLKSWWMDKPVLHILPHWNWAGKEGQEIAVWAYSNCDEVELFLNKKSMGKKTMLLNAHLEWKVRYQAGTLEAIGYKKGKKIVMDKVETTTSATTLQLAADKASIEANTEDIAILTVDAIDKNNWHVPTANDEISFLLEGPGIIIGVGNGDPASMEKDKFIETIQVAPIENLKEKITNKLVNMAEIAVDFDDSKWGDAFKDVRDEQFAKTAKVIVYRGGFVLPQKMDTNAIVNFLYKFIGTEQSVYVNGHLLAADIRQNEKSTTFMAGKRTFLIDKNILVAGKNVVTIVSSPLIRKNQWSTTNQDAGAFQIVTPAAPWKRSLFNGLAQVIVQSTGQAGNIIVTATANGLKQATIKINAKQALKRPSI